MRAEQSWKSMCCWEGQRFPSLDVGLFLNQQQQLKGAHSACQVKVDFLMEGKVASSLFYSYVRVRFLSRLGSWFCSQSSSGNDAVVRGDLGRTLLFWQQWPLLWAQTTLGKFTQNRWNPLPKMIYQTESGFGKLWATVSSVVIYNGL